MHDKRNGQIIFNYKPLPNAEREIYDKIGGIAISMKEIDHLQMPEPLTVEHKVQLSETEQKRYDILRKNTHHAILILIQMNTPQKSRK